MCGNHASVAPDALDLRKLTQIHARSLLRLLTPASEDITGFKAHVCRIELSQTDSV